MAPALGRELTADEVRRLYTERTDLYHWFFADLLGYGPGIRALVGASGLLASGQRILDAGCGTGVVSRGVLATARRRGLTGITIDGFDLTPAMLARFREWLAANEIGNVTLTLGDVCDPRSLPEGWNGYDLVVSSAMLEYLPKASLAAALGHLRARLRPGGHLLFAITRRNPLMAVLIERWWESHAYQRAELERHVRAAGFGEVRFGHFPFPYRWLDLWGHVVVARNIA